VTEKFKAGDRVKWNSRNGEVVGEVEEKLTEPTDIKKHHVNASPDDPQYLVKSDKTGKQAAHHPQSLEKLDE
jgi:Hypervirulence associated proteins TUDOR domain